MNDLLADAMRQCTSVQLDAIAKASLRERDKASAEHNRRGWAAIQNALVSAALDERRLRAKAEEELMEWCRWHLVSA